MLLIRTRTYKCACFSDTYIFQTIFWTPGDKMATRKDPLTQQWKISEYQKIQYSI